MPRPVKDDDGDVLDGAVLRLRYGLDVVLDGRLDVDVVGSFRAGDELLHVENRRRVIHRAAVGHGHDRDGVVHALGGQRGAVDGVDGDVTVGTVAVADLLAVVEHGRFVLLALADDDDALHRHGGDQLAHRVDRGRVGPVLVTASDPSARGHRSSFGDTDELEGEVAIWLFGSDAQRPRDSGYRHASDAIHPAAPLALLQGHDRDFGRFDAHPDLLALMQPEFRDRRRRDLSDDRRRAVTVDPDPAAHFRE